MHCYRVTKYNPSLRNSLGEYLGTEWTTWNQVKTASEIDVGLIAAYQKIEDAYIESAMMFMNESGVKRMNVKSVQDAEHRLPLLNGDSIAVSEMRLVIQGLLREEYWCKLESRNAFIHSGNDFYLYVGVPRVCAATKTFAQSRGLFVEDYRSPYL